MKPKNIQFANYEDVTINVTQDHIKYGKKRLCGVCPVALALKEKVLDAWVNEKNIALLIKLDDKHGIWVNYEPSDKIINFIEAFDNDYCTVNPFSFNIKIPVE